MQNQIFEIVRLAIIGLAMSLFSFLTAGAGDFAFQPNLIYSKAGDIEILETKISQSFYDELAGISRNYYIESDKDFILYLNLLVPELINKKGKYSADIFLVKDNGINEKIATLDGKVSSWVEYYESLGREYYLKGPELEKQLPPGKYKIEVFSAIKIVSGNVAEQTQTSLTENSNTQTQIENIGKYVLVIGKEKSIDFNSLLALYAKIPTLKLEYFQTPVWQFLLSPLGILLVGFLGIILIFLVLINYFIGVIKHKKKQIQARTILLTSGGMTMKSEITKLLQKPAYDITVAFIITGAKTGDYADRVKNDYLAMKEMGFNIMEVDIDGKTMSQVTEILQLRDIIFVADGNAYLLMAAMKKCNFKKIIKKLLKQGRVYLGSGSGSIVAGKTIRTAGWIGQEKVAATSLKGLGLVNFDLFVHYTPECDTIIKKKLPFKFQRRKIKFLTDQQAILKQGKTVLLLGEGNKINI